MSCRQTKINSSHYTRTFYTEWQLQENRYDYNVVIDQELEGSLDVDRLSKALSRLVSDVNLLNSHLEEIDDELCWVPNSHISEIEFFTKPKSQEELLSYVKKPFNMQTGPLYRFAVVCLSADRFRFILVIHHMLYDGNKFEQLVKLISSYYSDPDFTYSIAKNDQQSKLINKFTTLNNQVVKDRLECKSFWKACLDAIEPPDISFLSSGASTGCKTGELHEIIFGFAEDFLDKLLLIKKKYNISPFFYSQAIFALVLHKYTGQKSIGISYPISIKGCKDIIYGAQVNTNVMPYDFTAVNSVADLIKQTASNVQKIYAQSTRYGYCLVGDIASVSNQSLFNVSFVQSNLRQTCFDFENIKVLKINNDLNVNVVNNLSFMQEIKAGVMSFKVNYNSGRLEDSFVRSFVEVYKRLLLELTSTLDIKKIKDIKLLTSNDSIRLQETYNEVPSFSMRGVNVIDLFEAQVRLTPNKIAVRYESSEISYKSLNAMVNQFGRYLQECGVIRRETVGVYMPRSIEAVVTLLAINKVGATFVPLDIQYPRERVAYILCDAAARFVVSCNSVAGNIASLSQKALLIDEIQLSSYDKTNINLKLDSLDLSYIIYTSGSTGKPKGVMTHHKGFSHYLQWAKQYYDVAKGLGSPVHSSLAFDLTLTSIYVPLISGCCIDIISESSGIDGLLAALQSGINYSLIKITPAHLKLLQVGLDKKNLSEIKATVVIGGEALYEADLNFWRTNAPGLRFINEYGATETSVACTTYELQVGDSFAGSIPVGRGMPNHQMYVLNKHLQPVLEGVVGEIYLSGPQLSAGYLNQPELTRERFIPHPFISGEKLYKTRDLGRWTNSGQVEFVARIDDQVKIKGYRVELGEIEYTLLQHAEIEQVVVLLKELNSEKVLVCYYVGEAEIALVALEKYLLCSLPSYMVPDAFVYLKKFPLTVNGKIDRNALPEPTLDKGRCYVAPRDKLEESLCEIWSGILGVERVGIEDDFFRLGGNSITALQVIHKTSRKLELHIKLSDIFTHKKISCLVGNVLNNGSVKIAKCDGELFPLSFAQERLWFIEKLEGGTDLYHVSRIWSLHKDTDVNCFSKSLNAIINRHHILRTTFIKDSSGSYLQKINAGSLDIKKINVKQDALDDSIKLIARQPFDLESEWPIRICLFSVSGNFEPYTVSLIVVHHIAFDGWSADIFQKELGLFYRFYTTGKPTKLNDLEIQYKDYSTWQRHYLTGQRLAKQLDYWQEYFAGYEQLRMPTDKVRPNKLDYNGADVGMTLSKELSRQLRDLAKETGVTLFTVMLSAFMILLAKYCGQDDVIVGTPVANRQYSVLADLIGFFINSLVTRQVINKDMQIVSLIKSIQDSLVQAQDFQDLPFEKLVDALGIERDLSIHPLFQVMFRVQNFGDENIAEGQESLYGDYDLKCDNRTARFDLLLLVNDSEEELHCNFNYATSLFNRESIVNLSRYYELVLHACVLDVEQSVESVNLLSKKEYQCVVDDWNITSENYFTKQTIHSLFEEQVQLNPNKIALIVDDVRLTYAELNCKVNKLANYLIDNIYIGPDDLLVLCLERTQDMLIAILAVLKSGGAYVPLSASYPAERIGYIMQDTMTKVVLTNINHAEKISAICTDLGRKIEVLAIDSPKTNKILSECSNANPIICVKPNNLCYVIYTSGTTGKPKGVMVEHEQYLFYQHNFISLYKHYCNDDMVSVFTMSYCFDASLPTMFSPILSGGKLVLTPGIIDLNIDSYIKNLNLHEVNLMRLTPSMLGVLGDSLRHIDHDVVLVLGGEPLDFNSLRYALDNKHITTINQYGPTEAIVGTTYNFLENLDSRRQIIGKPYAGKYTYVLDTARKPVPVGVIGELYIGGDGLARGYLNDSDMTNSRFIINPFKPNKNQNNKLYQTGDLVRWMPDGSLEYIGRNDFQVKIRGFRVELGEVEAAISKFSEIQRAVVLAKERTNGDKCLIGYYVAECPLDSEHLESYLSATLPDYMIPDSLIFIDKLPLTINNKIDREALLKLSLEATINYVPPRNDLELAMCQIWQNVLEIEKVGIQDDFFKSGGNSILAIRVVHKTSQVLGERLPIAKIFEHKKIANLTAHILSKSDIDIEPTNELVVELSFAQERLWFIEQYEGGTDLYHIPMIWSLLPQTHIGAFKKALVAIVERHSILRTIFSQNDKDEYLQQVVNGRLNIIEDTVDHLTLERNIQTAIHTAFDLEHEWPIRVHLYTVNQENIERRVVVIIVHHIAFDGWSVDIFRRELNILYKHFAFGDVLSLPRIQIQYKDYSLWQKSYLTGDVLSKQLDYWKSKLLDFEPVNFPTDYARPANFDYRGKVFRFSLDELLSGKLRELAKLHGVTLYTVLLSAFLVLLSKVSGQQDIILGSPIANRHYAEISNLIGFFVNSLVVRQNVKPNITIAALMEEVHVGMVQAQAHQDLPFEKLIEALGTDRDLSRHPIFQIMFIVQNFGKTATGKNQVPLYEDYDYTNKYQVAKFDITLFINDAGGSLTGSFHYALSLFCGATIERISLYYTRILESFVSNAEKEVSTIKLLSDLEYKKIVYDWNNIKRVSSKNQTVHSLFEEIVAKFPNRIAISLQGKKITYSELNLRANKLAHFMRNNSYVMPGDLVAMCISRDENIIITILSIFKLGAAYVPIEYSYPCERIKYIIADSKISLIITNSAYKNRVDNLVENDKICVLSLDDNSIINNIDAAKSCNLDVVVQNTDLAYIIYTSGTTGMPKGVLQPHKNVHRLFSATHAWYDFNEEDVWILFHSYVFDFSVWEIWGALIFGGRLVIPSHEQTRDFKSFYDLCLSEKVTVLNQTPSAFYSLIEVALQMQDGHKLSALRYVIFGGEALNIAQLKPWCDSYGYVKPKLVNMYGITETTVHVTYKHIEEADLLKASVIGQVIPDLTAYVLDNNLYPVPLGAVGELYVGGEGLALGYLNRKNLTAEKFISNPFQTKGESKENINNRIYKTGDLVRWLPNQQLEYIGRDDCQVKIRGFRIELGEVEFALSSHPDIKHSVVLSKSREDGSKYLAGYYVAGAALATNNITSYLAQKLPEYMLPKILIHLESLPLTINGKLDRKALPEARLIASELGYVSPRNELEKLMCNVWQAVLGINKIGIEDDFFTLGGDSILSIQLTSRLRKEGIDCRVKHIFEHRTIVRLCLLLAANKSELVNVIKHEEGSLQGKFPLLPIQKWFFEKHLSHPNIWNQSFLIKVPKLDQNTLENAIHKMADWHDMLRVRYVRDKTGTYCQQYFSKIDIPKLETLNISLLNQVGLVEQLTSWQSVFDIENGPLWKIAYLYGYPDNSARIFIACHHLLIDTVSWRIIVEDLQNLYAGRKLGNKGTSYRQWVEEIDLYQNKSIDNLQYWLDLISDQKSHEQTCYVNTKQHCAKISLDKPKTEELLRDVNLAYHTEINDLLLTALAYALSSWNNEDVNHIILEGHGREDLNPSIDISQTLGWFTTIFPVRVSIKQDLATTIMSIKEMLRMIPDKGLSYGALKYGETSNKLKSHQLPSISFNYLGQFTSASDSEPDEWRISGEDSGRSVLDETNLLININGMVTDGCLRFTFSSHLTAEQTQNLANSFKQNLEKIILHCHGLVSSANYSYTPSDFPLVSISKECLDNLMLSPHQVEHIFPASSLQQGFIYHVLSYPEDDAYRVQLLYDYHDKFNIDIYKSSWNMAVQKYPILRTGFNWDSELIQVIYRKGDLNFYEHDISDLDDKDHEIELIRLKDRERRFELSKPTQMRIHIIKVSNDLHTVLISQHHIILDGWSGPVLRKSVHDYYQELLANRNIKVIEDKSYLEAQEYYKSFHASANTYWENQLVGICDANNLDYFLQKSFDLDEMRVINSTKTEILTIPEDLCCILKSFAMQEGVTLNVLLQFAWHKLIHLYTGDRTTIVGTVTSGREIPVHNIEKSVGLYINTLPLVIDWGVDADFTIRDQIKEIHKKTVAINEHGFASLSRMQTNGRRLFHSLFVFENYPLDSDDETEFVCKRRRGVEKVNYPLNFVAYEKDSNIVCKLEYADLIIDKNRVTQGLEVYSTILQNLPNLISKQLNEMCFLSKKDYTKIIYEWNNTDKEYDFDCNISSLFSMQAASCPNSIAIVCGGRTLTYSELDIRVNEFAGFIQQLGAATEDLIAVCMDRSEHMIVAILSILKTGAAYVPIDPGQAQARIEYMLNDTKTKIVLTDEQYYNDFVTISDSLCNDLTIVTLGGSIENQSQSGDYTCASVGPRNLAYVIYTSGTTGNPKGVTIEHRSVINYIYNIREKVCKERKLCFDFSTNFAFDLSVTCIFTALLTGNILAIYEGDTKDLDGYKRHLQNEKINFVKWTPSYFGLVKEYVRDTYLDIVMLGGEKLNIEMQEILENSNIDFYDEYGPTESTVGACLSKLECGNKPNIGQPYANYKVYVLNDNLNPVGIGMPGELYISGVGVTRGYLNSALITQEKIITNHFIDDCNPDNGDFGLLYKTGDIVRWLPDGNLEYINRRDFQVKIRGFRIELGEIEAALSRHALISQCVVLAKSKENSAKYLAAYYVSSKAIHHDLLLTHLENYLPSYMLPALFVHLDAIPLTANGKVNLNLLPDPQLVDKDYVAPRNKLEKIMCSAWKSLLGIDKIGVESDFFRMGGDSILSIQLSSRLRQKEINCSVKQIFEYRTIARICNNIYTQSSLEKITIKTEEGVLTGRFGLLPIQKWFFEKDLKFINHWNQSFLVKVPVLNLERLSNAVDQLVVRHDMLRVIFEKNNNTWQQVYRDKINSLSIEYVDVSQCNSSLIIKMFTDWQSGLNITRGPLWRINYLTGYADGSARIYFTLHHLLIDTVSWRILIEDLKALYEGKLLPQKGTSYRQWVAAVENYGESQSKKADLWLHHINDAPNYTNSINSEKTQHTATCLFSSEQTQVLLRTSNLAYHSQINDLLLTALAYVLQSWSMRSINHIVLEGHGREDIAPDLDISRTVGWFTSNFPFKLEVKQTLDATVKYIKESLRSIPDKGLGYGALRYSEAENKLSGYLLPLVGFNYLGQFDSHNGSSLWQITREQCGSNARDASNLLININGMVLDGRLSFSFSCYLTKDETQSLSREFESQLNQLIAHCQQKINLNEMSYTPSDFPLASITQHTLERLESNEYVIEAIYPATSLQQGFLYHHLAYPEDDAYKVQSLYDYHLDSFDLVKYKQSWDLAVATYPILRTAFDVEDEIIQIIYKHGCIKFYEHDICTAKNKDQEIERICGLDRKNKFDLAKPTPLRIHIIKQADNLHTVIISQHHIISDGWSFPILRDTVHRYYNTLAAKKRVEVLEDRVFFSVQEYYGKNIKPVEKYWSDEISQIQNSNDLSYFLKPGTHLDDLRIVNKVAVEELVFSGECYDNLKSLVSFEGITLNVLLQFSWHKLINMYTGDDITIVGTITSGRDIPVNDIEKSVGFYLNTLPLIINWDVDKSFTSRQQLQVVHHKVIELNQYGFARLAGLQSEGERLFDSLFTFENYPTGASSLSNEMRVQHRFSVEKADYPLNIVAYEKKEKIVFKVNYDSEHVCANKIKRLLKHINCLLEILPDCLDKPLTEINLLSSTEMHRILATYNQVSAFTMRDASVIELFEAQVKSTPNRVAVRYESYELTYDALNSRANQFGQYLQQYGVKGNEAVGVYMPRSIDAVVILLAINKIGATFVPLDIQYPRERVTYILRDAAAKCVVSCKSVVDNISSLSQEVLLIDEIELSSYDYTNINVKQDLLDLSYIIYTSGSTGKPKGVMTHHKGFSHYLQWAKQYYDVVKGLGAPVHSSLAFDLTLTSIYAPLISGCCVDMISESAGIDGLLKALQSGRNYSLIKITPAHLKLLQVGLSKEILSAIKATVVIGGEALYETDLNFWRTNAPDLRFINEYGATETSVACTTYELQVGDSFAGSIPVGRGMPNHQMYVLDKYLQVVPEGVVGEIYLAGPQLSAGYLNQPELTNERFISNPFISGEKMYKTRDLGRWTGSGQVEFVARIDDQVKVRGYRVEIGEIEAILLQHAEIEQAVVLLNVINSEKRLTCYYVSKFDIALDNLEQHLTHSLPLYMVPDYFIRLESIPLTVNGKIDRKLLPEPSLDGDLCYTAPRSQLEESLCQIWSSVLGVERIGIEDDFFRLGGNSIAALQVAHKINSNLNMALKITDILMNRTIKSLSNNCLTKNEVMEDNEEWVF